MLFARGTRGLRKPSFDARKEHRPAASLGRGRGDKKSYVTTEVFAHCRLTGSPACVSETLVMPCVAHLAERAPWEGPRSARAVEVIRPPR